MSPGGLDTFDRERKVVERAGNIARGILDRESGDPGGRRGRDVGADSFRTRRKAAFEVCADGNLDALAERPKMSQDLLERDAVVRPAEGPGKSGTGGRQRREAELREQPGAAQVPWIGNNKASGLVQLAKQKTAIGRLGHRS